MLKWRQAYFVNRFTGPAGMSKVQPCGPDFTCQNRIQVNTYCLLLSSFVCFNVWVKVNSLLLRLGISVHTWANSFHYMSLLLLGLKQQSASSRKAAWRKKGKHFWYMKKRKQTENSETLGSKQPVVKSVCCSLTMRRRAASAIIVRHWMHNLEGIKDHERSALHEHHIKIAQAKKGPRQTDGARLEKSLTQQQREKMILLNSECHC